MSLWGPTQHPRRPVALSSRSFKWAAVEDKESSACRPSCHERRRGDTSFFSLTCVGQLSYSFFVFNCHFFLFSLVFSLVDPVGQISAFPPLFYPFLHLLFESVLKPLCVCLCALCCRRVAHTTPRAACASQWCRAVRCDLRL